MIRQVLIPLLLVCLSQPTPGKQTPQTPVPQGTVSNQQTDPRRDDEQDVVRINSNLVQVDVVVTKDNKLITDLTADDFEIFEDGHPQSITNFSYISNLPSASHGPTPGAKGEGAPTLPAVIRPETAHRTIALVVDDLNISFETMGRVKSQLRRFVSDDVQPGDLVAIIRTGGEVGALQQFTTDKRFLFNAIDRLHWNHCSAAGVSVFAPQGSNSRPTNGGSLCSEMSTGKALRSFQFILKGMRQMPGRKSLVVLSDSLPLQDQPSDLLEGQLDPQSTTQDDGLRDARKEGFNYQQILSNIAELAIRSAVVIYAVHTVGLMPTGPTAADDFSASRPNTNAHLQSLISARSRQLQDSKAGAELLVRKTGGFLIQNSNDFGLSRIMQDQEGYYLLGYRPRDETFNRSFHRINVRVKPTGLTVRSRSGFFGVTDAELRTAVPAVSDQLNMALMSPFGLVEIDLRMNALFVNQSNVGSVIRSTVYLDARDLTFTTDADGWHRATIDVKTILFGDNGAVAGEKSRRDTLSLRGQTFERALREGFVYTFHMPVPLPGTYQFRIAVRDSGTARIGTAGQFIEVPDLRKPRIAMSGITVLLDAPSSVNANKVNGDEKPVGVATRRFRPASNLFFGYVVYNATLDSATHLPRLTTQTNVYRDGKLMFAGTPKPFDLTGQQDMMRLKAASALQLGTQLAPGDYILQIVVSDLLAKDKYRKTEQSIDFEVVK